MKNILFGILVFPLLINAQTLVVDADRSCMMFIGCKSCESTIILDNPYETIQEAINDANNGDTISICDATYDEQVKIINKNNLTIKKSDSATDNVIVKNSGDVFTLNGVDGITIDSMKIEQTSGNDGISVKSYSKDILLKNMIITSDSGDGIETYGSNGKFTIENSTIEAEDEGIDFSGVISEVTISDTNITTTGTGDNHGVKSEEIINDGITIKNTFIDTKAIGLYFKKNVNGGLNIVDSKIKSKLESLELTKTVNGGVNITNSSFNSTEDDSIDFNKNINDGLDIRDTNITASINAMEIAGDINGVATLSNVKIVSLEKALEFSQKINNGITIENSDFEAKTFGIEINGDINNGINITDTIIKAQDGEAISLQKINGGIILNNVTINSKSYGIKLEGKINNEMTFSNLDITSSESDALQIDKEVKDGFSIKNSKINAKGRGFEFVKQLDGELKIDDVNITSGSHSIYFKDKIKNGIEIKNSDINSTSDIGLYFNNQVKGSFKIDNLTVNAYSKAIYIQEKNSSPVITNSTITSLNDDAIYSKNNGSSKFTLTNNCVRTKKAGSFYALDLNTNNTKAKVSKNCFYASEAHRLAYAKKDGNDIDGNYWDGVSGDYVDSSHHISDTNTMQSCNLTCSGKAILLADYHFDECSVSNDANKVDDNSSNDNNATAFRDVTSTDGKINNAYDFDGVDLPDYVSVPSVVLDAKTNYSLSMWVKPTSLNNKDTFISAEKTDDNLDEMLFRISNNKVAFKHKGDDGEVSFDTTISDFTLNEWNYIALTKKGKEVCFYLNGNVKDCKTSTSDNFNSALGVLDGTFMIGQDSAGVDKYFENGNFEGAIDEVKFFEGALSEDEVDDIYNNEKSGKNYDGTNREVIDCTNNGSTSENYNFDVWDKTKSTEPELNDRDILTKIANESFELHLSEVNATDYNDDFDGTVCSVVFDTANNTTISDWVKTTWESSDDDNQTNISFTVDKAVKVAKVYTYWYDNSDDCGGTLFSHENNDSNSTDDFAIRPKELVISSISDLKAGEAFTFEVTADTDDYNVTLDVNVDLNDTSKTCDDNRADFNLTSVDFKDGDSSTSAKFDEVGIVDINITDKTWAEVDNDDTPQTCDAGGTYVCSNTIQAKIYPAKFGVNFKTHPNMENNSTTDGFTYLSSDLNMSAWLRNLDINISALNSADEVTKNFDKECYEDSVKVDFTLNRPKDDNSNDANLTYNPDDNDKSDELGFEKGLVDINNSDFGFNFTRVYDKPRNPFFVDGNDSNVSIDVEDNNHTDAKGSVVSDFDDNTTFYYARISTADKETTDNPIAHFSEVEVYDNNASSYVSGFKQNSINWYANAKHSGAFVTLLEIDATKKSTLNDVKFSISSFTTDASKVKFEISNDTKDTYRMHIKIKPWFWYFPSSIGKTYNEADGSDCTEHPCFEYMLKKEADSSGVKSGEFTGSNHDVKSRGKYEKTGVKVFR